jgi:hypothetical protein
VLSWFYRVLLSCDVIMKDDNTLTPLLLGFIWYKNESEHFKPIPVRSKMMHLRVVEVLRPQKEIGFATLQIARICRPLIVLRSN